MARIDVGNEFGSFARINGNAEKNTVTTQYVGGRKEVGQGLLAGWENPMAGARGEKIPEPRG